MPSKPTASTGTARERCSASEGSACWRRWRRWRPRRCGNGSRASWRLIASWSRDWTTGAWIRTGPRLSCWSGSPGTWSVTMGEFDEELERWRDHYRKTPERDAEFETLSGEPLQPLYTPQDVRDLDYARDLGFPGHYPFTRGVYHSMYRGRLWTMRQFAGFGSAEETNARYKFLLRQGQGGLSVAFDMPTLMGRDSDDPRSEGEVGRCGVATDSLEDFETLFGGIPLADITTSMTISGPATILFAFFLAAAEKQGVDWKP